ncbi:hypothetical protein [Nocardia sp. NPDC051570]|uniref:hypothetical protein n=1 Tax=Nocardia sp. NPDC051570 TaxID=3364324 RepID=UPI0037B40285
MLKQPRVHGVARNLLSGKGSRIEVGADLAEGYVGDHRVADVPTDLIASIR